MMDAQAEALRLQIEQLLKKAQFASVVAVCELRMTDENADVRVTALLGVNSAAFSSGDLPLAKQYLVQAVQLAREQGSPIALCNALIRYSSMTGLLELTEAPEARLTLAQEVLALAEPANYKRGIVYAKLGLAAVHGESGAKNVAQHELEDALDTARQSTSDVEGDTLNTLAMFFYSKKSSVKAIDYGKRALKIAQAMGDEATASILMSNMSYYYFKVARDFRSYDSSLEYSQQALALARKLGFFHAELYALMALAHSYQIARLNQKAAETFSAALGMARSSGNTLWEYECVYWLSDLYGKMRENDQAAEYAQQELALAAEKNRPLWKLHALNVLGNMHHRKKRPDLALECWRKALALQDELGVKHGFAYYFSRFNIAVYPLINRFLPH